MEECQHVANALFGPQVRAVRCGPSHAAMPLIPRHHHTAHSAMDSNPDGSVLYGIHLLWGDFPLVLGLKGHWCGAVINGSPTGAVDQ